MSRIVLDRVSKVYAGSDSAAVDDLSLTIDSGEFMVLVGPSGCGKSTLLRMIAGLEDVSSGAISIGERDVTYVAPRDRDIAMVFQNYALYPHMTVQRNLAYALKVRRMPKNEIGTRVAATARMLGLEDLLQRRPAALSGGQRQRVAMGRAIVREPGAFLMDEPLSNLDAKLRVMMRGQLAQLHDRLGITTVYVTHDQVEAMTLGQRVTVMRDGVIQQVGPPQELYRRPTNLFVAAFIGSPPMNLVEATVDENTVRFADFVIPLSGAPASRGRVVLGIRPESFSIPAAGSDLPTMQVVPVVIEELGALSNVIFQIDAPPVHSDAVQAAIEDDPSLLASERTFFTAALDARARLRVGEPMSFAVKPTEFHFFDPDIGRRLSVSEDSELLVSSRRPQ